MQQAAYLQPSSSDTERGELFSILLRLHPTEAGMVSPSSGSQAHAAFLDIVRQNDPALAEALHRPNQRRPFTVGLLQGFNHLSARQLEEAVMKNQKVLVSPGQVYWLRITMLDAAIFGMFVHHLITRPRTMLIRLGDASFEISRLIGSSDSTGNANPWAAYSSFEELGTQTRVQKHYTFEFASPTAFSKGQKSWGKLLKLFPEPALVFESLAKQWETFAPLHVRMTAKSLSIQDFVAWCEEYVLISRYSLETCYLPGSKFGQTGFQGTVTYEVKGARTDPEAIWLTPLSRFALFSGVGYKTTMGMGQARCKDSGRTHLIEGETAESEVPS
ncbi:MAG TPA: CRISPR system precrRNA processing endoribonuclease RAMP protein Cas6 [Ktedonobacteraceae bacterium]|nr:CRISPR system precrRNA processing endoribonuclease RAMP protein Cas6 [Ktedonobacteraceae bacterium]